MRSSDNLHKWAKHDPANSAGYTVPATVPGVRRLQDDVPLVLAVHKPDDIDDRIAEPPAVGLAPEQRVKSVHKGREPPMADRVSVRKPLDSADEDMEPVPLRQMIVAVVAASIAVAVFAPLVGRYAVLPDLPLASVRVRLLPKRRVSPIEPALWRVQPLSEQRPEFHR